MKMRGLTIAPAAIALGIVALAAPQAASAWCFVDLDKCIQVDDEGNGFEDDECVDEAAGVPEGTMVRWGYQVTNTSDWYWDLHNCEISDPDAGFSADIPGVLKTPLVNGGVDIVYSEAAECIDIVNTATVLCDCEAAPEWPNGYTGGSGGTATDTDTAKLACVPEEGQDWTLEKECGEYVEDADVPFNPFMVTVNNAGPADLTCSIVGEAVGGADIPVCSESSGFPCYTCEHYSGSVAAGASRSVACELFGLEANATDTIYVECTDGDAYTDTKDASDLCTVPGQPDWTLEKLCEPQTTAEGVAVPYNPFTVTVYNTGSVDLSCSILGEGINDAPIPVCPETEAEYPCYRCSPMGGNVAAGASASANCAVFGLDETSKNTVGVECTDGGDYTFALRASDTCEVEEIPPSWELSKVCDEQTTSQDVDLPYNPFRIYVSNTGEVDLSCRITGDAVNDVRIPICGEDGLPCFQCEAYEGALPAGESEIVDCRLFGLDATAIDTVGVECTDGGDYTFARRASDACEVEEPPPPGFEIEKKCLPPRTWEPEDRLAVMEPDGIVFNPFGVRIANTGETPLACEIIGDAVNDEPIPRCDANGDALSIVPPGPCYLCEFYAAELGVGGEELIKCALFGLDEGAKDTVGVSCSYDDWTLAKRASDWCPYPELEVEKDCYEYGGNDAVNGEHPPSHEVRIVVTNDSKMDFDNCRVEDYLDVVCPEGANGRCPFVECDYPEQPFSLGAGEDLEVYCHVYGGGYEDILNKVEASCDAGKLRLEAWDEDFCEGEEKGECRLRSPGFYKTHPAVVAYLAWMEPSLASCGEPLGWVDHDGFDWGFAEALCDEGWTRERKCAAATLNLHSNIYFDTMCVGKLDRIVEACCTECGDSVRGDMDCDEALDWAINDLNSELLSICPDDEAFEEAYEPLFGEVKCNAQPGVICENGNGPPGPTVAPASRRFQSPMDGQRFELAPNGWWQYLFQAPPTGSEQLFQTPGTRQLPAREK